MISLSLSLPLQCNYLERNDLFPGEDVEVVSAKVTVRRGRLHSPLPLLQVQILANHPRLKSNAAQPSSRFLRHWFYRYRRCRCEQTTAWRRRWRRRFASHLLARPALTTDLAACLAMYARSDQPSSDPCQRRHHHRAHPNPRRCR